MPYLAKEGQGGVLFIFFFFFFRRADVNRNRPLDYHGDKNTAFFLCIFLSLTLFYFSCISASEG